MSPVDGMEIMNSNQPTMALGSKSVCPSKATGYRGYNHITWYVGNAKQLASCYITRMGFEYIAYRGLETGSRAIASHVISNNGATFVLIAPIRPRDYDDDLMTDHDRQMLQEIHAHLSKHGDAVKDVAFEVDDARAVYSTAIAKGAGGVQEPKVEQDEEGKVVTAVLKTYGDVTHTLVERSGYRGAFLPGYCAVTSSDPSARLLPAIKFNGIDHCVGNQGWDELQSACEYYEQCLDFHRFWSVDDRGMCTDFSAMNSVVIASENGAVKMPLNEPAVGLRRSQIEEFIDFHAGAGVQHIAFLTQDIITCVTNLKQRGMQFIEVPHAYYAAMKERLKRCDMVLDEDLDAIEKLHILIDFDDTGYLLQIFTKPLTDRPTIFLEIIQRNNFTGFGAGNFKALFEAVEREQAQRGNL